MADFGLQRRYPLELLHLDQNLTLGQDISSVLTNFQLDALRFLWSQLKRKTRFCLYNDGRHMGKRITLAALLNVLIAHDPDLSILVACDSDEEIVNWIFKLNVFNGKPESYRVHAPQSRPARRIFDTMTSSPPITFINYRRHKGDVNKLIQENSFRIVVMDVEKNATPSDLRLGLSLPQECLLLVVYSPELDGKTSNVLQGLLRQRMNLSSWTTLRRVNEQHLREFPWIDQRKFRVKLEEWKGDRSVADILAKRIEERKIEALVEGVVPLEESQEMERLFVETDDEATPVKIQLPERFTSRSSLLGSMYLRISQSSANTPKQVTLAPPVQDSPDLFASMMDDDYDDEVHATDDEAKQLEIPPLPDTQPENHSSDGDTTNPFDKSTPLTPSIREIDIPSQSPIRLDLPRPDICAGLEDTQVVDDKSDVFEITSNEVFNNQVKVTRNNKHELVDGDDLLKFDSDEIILPKKELPVTPTRRGKHKYNSSVMTSPSSSGWLSKRTSPKKTTPEKVLAKKRRSVVQFYASHGSSGSADLHSSLDFSKFEDETQRWNAC